MPYLNVTSRLSQRALEELHLARYCNDHLLGQGALPYEELTSATNPPDFFARVPSGQRVGVDCAQFTTQSRRRVNGAFLWMRRAVLAEPRERFTKLRGSNVYMWFEGEPNSLPYRRTDTAAIQEMVDTLAEYEPDFAAFDHPYRLGPPDPAPSFPKASTPHGCSFFACPLRGAVPTTQFFNATGFELGVGYTTSHSAESETAVLRKLLEGHDKPEIDHLVISVGAPNRDGLAFRSEEEAVDLALKAQIPSELSHIQTVRVHFWSTGAIVETVPTQQVVQPPLYQGMQISYLAR